MTENNINVRDMKIPDAYKKGISAEQLKGDTKLIELFNNCDIDKNGTLDENEVSVFNRGLQTQSGGYEQPEFTTKQAPSSPEKAQEQIPEQKTYSPSPDAKALTLTYGQTQDGKPYTNAVVQNGETIPGIAKTFNSNAKEIVQINKGAVKKSGNNTYFIAGQEIKIPGIIDPSDQNYDKLVDRKSSKEIIDANNKKALDNADPYNRRQMPLVVKKGDTYYKLAQESLEFQKKENITKQDIVNRMLELQKLNNNEDLIVGKEIMIPSQDGTHTIRYDNGSKNVYNFDDQKGGVKKMTHIDPDGKEAYSQVATDVDLGSLVTSLSKKEVTIKESVDFLANIKKITPENITSTLESFEGGIGFGLTDVIMVSKHDNFTKKMAMEHIVAQAEELAKTNRKFAEDVLPRLKEQVGKIDNKTSIDDIKRMGVDMKKIVSRQDTTITTKSIVQPNGKYDVNFKQGNTGDCWLLAGIQSLSQTEKGKQLVNKCVTIDKKTGDATVTLPGVGKTYTVSAREIRGANNLSNGDGDIRALEYAVDKYFHENLPGGKADIDGNTTSKAFEVLVGSSNITTVNKTGIPDQLETLAKNGSKNAATVTGIGGSADTAGLDATVNGKKIKIYTGHAYTVSKVDKDYVYMVNPHNTSETIKMAKTDFTKVFNLMSTINL